MRTSSTFLVPSLIVCDQYIFCTIYLITLAGTKLNALAEKVPGIYSLQMAHFKTSNNQ